MKYIGFALLAILAVIVVLLLVAVINAVRIKAKPIKGKESLDYTPEEEKTYAEKLSKMVKVPSVSLRGNTDLTEFYKLHKVLEAEFPLIHEKLEKVEIQGNLLYKWTGKDSSRAFLLMGHQDVVPAEETDWKYDPFSGEIADGAVHGRGAMDCKCTVLAEMSAVEELLAENFVPECDVYLAFSANEEIFGGGADLIIDYLIEKGVRLSSVMDEGGTIMEKAFPGVACDTAAIGIVEKGNCNIKIIAKGAGGHSSTPPKNTPLARLAGFVNEVETKKPFKKVMGEPVKRMFASVAPYASFPMRLVLGNVWLFKPALIALLPALSSFGEAFLSTTCAFTMSGGSTTPNVIPDEAYVICNIRPSTHQDADASIAVLEKIAAKYDLIVEPMNRRSASKVTDPDGEEFAYLKQCINDTLPDVCVTPYFMAGATDCRFYERVTDNCLRFCPVKQTPKQLAAMHAANENISTDNLAVGVKFYKYYIKNHK